MATNQPTLADLMAQSTTIATSIAAYEIGPLTQAKDRLAADDVTALVSDVQAIMADLPDGAAKQQLGNIVTVLAHVPQTIQAELTRVQGIVNPPPVPQPIPGPQPVPAPGS